MRQKGNLKDASPLYGAARSLFKRIERIKDKQAEAKRGNAWCMRGEGEIALRFGEHERAKALYKEARFLFEANRDKRGEAWCIWGQGEVAWQTRALDKPVKLDGAEKFYIQAGSLFEGSRNIEGEAACIFARGEIARERGDFDTARKLYVQACELFREFGDKSSEASSLVRQGEIAQQQDKVDTAERLFKEAQVTLEPLWTRQNRPYGNQIAGILIRIARIMMNRQDRKACEMAKRVLEVASEPALTKEAEQLLIDFRCQD